MKGSSNTAKALAASAACLLHGAAIWAMADRTVVEMEGMTGAAEASLGNSFADLAAGTLSASEPEEVTEPVEADTAKADPVEQETPPEEAPETVAQDMPEETPAEQTAPDAMLPDTPVDTATAEPVPAMPVEADAALPVARAEPAEATEQTAAAEVVEAEQEPQPAVTRSRRPKRRSAGFETAHKPEPAPKQVAKAQPRGNSDHNAKTGTATGAEQAKVKAAATGRGDSDAAGNAAASNYPGQVMRKISRVPRPRVGSRGTAVVAFTIAPGGGLSAVSVARSSGSGQLDRAALTVIRRAAPFPAPPPGARRSFSIRIKGS